MKPTIVLAATIALGAGPRKAVSPHMVPDARTALRVGRALLEAHYGAALIERELPLSATLKGNVWTVAGRNPSWTPRSNTAVENKDGGLTFHVLFGGAAFVEIDRRDCRVLRLTHGE